MQGDPRTTKNIVYYSQVSTGDEKEASTEYLQLLAMVFSMTGFIFRNVWGAWLGIFFFISGLTGARLSTLDYGHLLTSFCMIVFSLMVNYTAFNRPSS
jgi:hypothetical protein